MGVIEIVEKTQKLQSDLSAKISDIQNAYDQMIGQAKDWLSSKLEEVNTLYSDTQDILEEKQAEIQAEFEKKMQKAEDFLKSKLEEAEQWTKDKINEVTSKMQSRIEEETKEIEDAMKEDAETKAKIAAKIKLKKKQ